ncbi:alpha/beta hydrolase [Solirubrobacter soli]|uniref:alpha/beta hydrolase n=1 Tax=Solirubrobacter soli TaxID=363832 RepID=UPI0003F5A389|nr:alpha/beta hydrolase [Solirubrobacter soli]
MASVLRLREDIAAWLWHPEGATGAVVLGHGLSAVHDQRLTAYAERFAAAGLAALVFDYRRFGSSGGEPRQLFEIKTQLEDWRIAIEHARGLPGIEKVGLFGSSFGGGHAITLAASEPVQAAVAQCPMTDGFRASLLAPKVTAAKLTKLALQDAGGALFGRAPKLVKAAGKPGEVALMSAQDTLPGFESITPPDTVWVNAISARAGLEILRYRPGTKASSITCPLLVCICDHDSLVDVDASERVAHEASQGEVVRYPIGHFEIYTGEWFERAVSRQAEFLARHLSAASPSA